jgi:beta-galactosidase
LISIFYLNLFRILKMNIKPALTPTSKLYIGSAYYPEQWPEANWKEDIRLMQAAGFNTVRLGDFAWSTLEPEEGQYEFDWLERAIAALGATGIDSVLCTPTAGPPAWLVSQYPDILPIDESGRRIQFGNRCHYCVNSPEFHAAVNKLVRQMAARFTTNPHVIGWQIDNEYNRYCYCERCKSLFQEYLAQRYETLEQLNTYWTTAYWSQTYTSWDQIPLPIGPHNPGLMLEFKHFMTHSYKQFQRMQIDELRPHLRQGSWVTHNFMYWNDGFDHYEISGDLDMATWDWYVGTGHHEYQTHGAAHDLVRGYKRRNFWLMETQPGNVNWKPINNALNKGEARVMAWHAVGHGAEAVLYWQWRSALNGQEQYHGTLLDASGQPRPFFTEAKQLATDFSLVSEIIAGSKLESEVALLNCYDSRWSIQWQPHQKDFDYVGHFLNYYRPLAVQNISIDIISADESLAGYKLVIAPALLILNDQRVEQFVTFVEAGGHLVLTVRCGMKDAYNALLPARQPGALRELSGVEVEEYYALDTPIPVNGDDWKGTSRIWAERLRVLDIEKTQVLATYGDSNGWLDGHSAITRHPFGKGTVTYIGAVLDEVSQKYLLQRIAQEAAVQPVMRTPDGVEACRRAKADTGEIYILINHNLSEQRMQLPWSGYEHLHQHAVGHELRLEPYGVAVLTHA